MVFILPPLATSKYSFGQHKPDECFSRVLFSIYGSLCGGLTSFCRFPDTFVDFVTQIAFSPTTNLLAWTNYDGSLYRWSEPIPSTSPDPVKSTSTTFDTRKIQRQATPTLFGDDITGGVNPQAPDNDEDAAAMDVFDDDNWILDDIGNGMEDDEPVVGTKASNGFVKEMGKRHR